MQVCSCGANGLAGSGSAVLLQVFLLHPTALEVCILLNWLLHVAECFRLLNCSYLYSFKLNSCLGCLI